MHEVAMHIEPSVDSFKDDFDSEGSRDMGITELLTPAHIGALTVCLTSIHKIFDTFLSIAVDTVRNLPVFHFVRVICTCILLIKMYIAAASINSELGKVISKEDLKVEQYLRKLLTLFKAAAEHGKSRPAQKFLMVLVMLKTWLDKQIAAKSGKSKHPDHAVVEPHDNVSLTLLTAEGISRQQATPRLGYRQIQLNAAGSDKSLNMSFESQHPPRQSTKNTPLHLLSEAAVGKALSDVPMPMSTRDTNGYDTYSPTAPYTRAEYSSSSVNGITTADGSDLDLDAALNDEMEQAMSMTLGEWDISSVLQADGLFDLALDLPPTLFEGCG